MIMKEALVLVALGGLVGLPLAFAAARSVAAMLYGVPPADVVSFAAGSAILAAVAAGSAYVPAYRASRISPMAALTR
jgi:ABC-type antimicrobial peptide transport system permease subunit